MKNRVSLKYFVNDCRYLPISSIYDSPKAVFHKGLFQQSGETSCLFTTSMLSTTLGLPEDVSHRESSLCFGNGGPRFFRRDA